jgi:hypothetical protein
MTTLWPVYYFHFDIVLLLASAAMAETLGALPLRRALAVWPIALVCVVGLVAVTVRIMASPQPVVIVDRAEGRKLLRQGFSRIEDDGATLQMDRRETRRAGVATQSAPRRVCRHRLPSPNGGRRRPEAVNGTARTRRPARCRTPGSGAASV